MERQEGHQEVVQRVRRGAWREVERERMELKEAGERMLFHDVSLELVHLFFPSHLWWEHGGHRIDAISSMVDGETESCM